MSIERCIAGIIEKEVTRCVIINYIIRNNRPQREPLAIFFSSISKRLAIVRTNGIFMYERTSAFWTDPQVPRH